MIPRASNSTSDLVSSNTILFETCQRQTGDRHLTRGVPNSSALMRESHHIVRRYTPAQLPDPVFTNVSSAGSPGTRASPPASAAVPPQPAIVAEIGAAAQPDYRTQPSPDSRRSGPPDYRRKLPPDYRRSRATGVAGIGSPS